MSINSLSSVDNSNQEYKTQLKKLSEEIIDEGSIMTDDSAEVTNNAKAAEVLASDTEIKIEDMDVVYDDSTTLKSKNADCMGTDHWSDFNDYDYSDPEPNPEDELDLEIEENDAAEDNKYNNALLDALNNAGIVLEEDYIIELDDELKSKLSDDELKEVEQHNEDLEKSADDEYQRNLEVINSNIKEAQSEIDMYNDSISDIKHDKSNATDTIKDVNGKIEKLAEINDKLSNGKLSKKQKAKLEKQKAKLEKKMPQMLNAKKEAKEAKKAYNEALEDAKEDKKKAVDKKKEYINEKNSTFKHEYERVFLTLPDEYETEPQLPTQTPDDCETETEQQPVTETETEEYYEEHEEIFGGVCDTCKKHFAEEGIN